MTADAQIPASDANAEAWGELLAGSYREIGERAMRDLPIYNDALGVEAVGFRWFNGTTIGIMVTPWFMNVVIPAGAIARILRARACESASLRAMSNSLSARSDKWA